MLTKLLRERAHVRVWRIILCGAVVKQNFEWEQVRDRFGDPDKKTGFIVNDCGNRDIWPVIGKFAGWRYGNAGTDGFGGTYVVDRFHDGGHSLFFDRAFVEKYWRPFIIDGHVVPGTARQGEGIPRYIKLLYKSPLNLQSYLFILVVLSAVLFFGVRWWMATPTKAQITLPAFVEEFDNAKSNGQITLARFADRYEGHQVTWDCIILQVKASDCAYAIGATPDADASEQVLAVFAEKDEFDEFLKEGTRVKIKGIVFVNELGIILSECQFVSEGT